MDQANNSPKYIRVKKHLNELIRSGKLAAGDQIPSENELMEKLGVSRNTVRQALGGLVNDGILIKHQGKGTFVRSLSKGGNSRLVGVINHSMMDNIYPDIIWGIETTLSENGYSFILSNSNHDKGREMGAVRRMLDQNICGLIIEPVDSTSLTEDDPLYRLLQKCGIPIVTTNCRIAGLGASAVSIDDTDLGYRAARYLIGRGHNKLAVVYKKAVLPGLQRRNGFAAGCAEAGYPLHPERDIVFAESDEPEHPGAIALERLLKLPDPPTAVFFYNDETALQALEAATKRGLSIPRDLSLLGVDNIRNAELSRPGLTTFDHPKEKLGQWAARIIMDQTEKSIVPSPEILMITPGLVERDSVGNPIKG